MELPPRDEMEGILKRGIEFTRERIQEVNGKQTMEVLPLELSAITFACIKMMDMPEPMKDSLMPELGDLAALVAYCTTKYMEGKQEMKQLDKLMG